MPAFMTDTTRMGLFAGLLLASPLALPHTPYLLPNAFEPINGGLITLDASFAEHFFTPEIVFDSSEFEVRQPDGSIVTPETVLPLKTRVVVEHELAGDGTYRFSTGRRLGRVFKAYELNGKTHMLENPEEPIPEGGQLVDFYQSLTMAEVYVTRGGPTDTVLAARGDGLEFAALTHPNDLFAGETLELQAVFSGEPLAGLTVDVFLAAPHAADESPLQTVTSDEHGEFSFTPEAAGVYLFRARHRAIAPAGMDAPEISHTYTLVVEAAE